MSTKGARGTALSAVRWFQELFGGHCEPEEGSPPQATGPSYRIEADVEEDVDFREDDRLEIESCYRRCIQCGRCSSSCPAAMMYVDFSPREIMRMLIMNDMQGLIQGQGLWRCGQCISCAARCPRNCNPAAAIQALRIVALRANPSINHMRLIESGVRRNLGTTGQTILPMTLAFPEDLMGPRTKKRRSEHNYNRMKVGYRAEDSRYEPIPQEDLMEIRALLRDTDFL
jgi:heterodisulfide reductase subunit C